MGICIPYNFPFPYPFGSRVTTYHHPCLAPIYRCKRPILFHHKALLPARLGILFAASTIVDCHSIAVTMLFACCFAVRSAGCSIVLPTCSRCRW